MAFGLKAGGQEVSPQFDLFTLLIHLNGIVINWLPQQNNGLLWVFNKI